MKAVIAATALAAAVLATPPVHAQTAISVQVATPRFGFQIGAPLLPAPVPVVPVPVYAPVPVYVAPPAVVYVPPRVLLPTPLVRPVVYPVAYTPAPRHRKHGHAEFRGAVARGNRYGFGPY